jgi:Domain of unknown function (DUF4431)
MSTRSVVLVVALSVAAQISLANEAKYGEPIVLSGTLKSGVGKTPDGQSITFPEMLLAKTITVQGNPQSELDKDTEPNTKIVQLVLSEELLKQYHQLKGRTVSVSCKLFHAHTGHHFTKVLCEASEINL